MTLKKQVEYILEKFPQSRDSDQWLTLKLWATFYQNKIFEFTEIESQENQNLIKKGKYVFLNDIMSLPREDHVKRIRADIQNVLGKWLPTSLEVVKQRKQNEERWRERMHRDTL